MESTMNKHITRKIGIFKTAASSSSNTAVFRLAHLSMAIHHDQAPEPQYAVSTVCHYDPLSRLCQPETN